MKKEGEKEDRSDPARQETATSVDVNADKIAADVQCLCMVGEPCPWPDSHHVVLPCELHIGVSE